MKLKKKSRISEKMPKKKVKYLPVISLKEWKEHYTRLLNETRAINMKGNKVKGQSVQLSSNMH